MMQRSSILKIIVSLITGLLLYALCRNLLPSLMPAVSVNVFLSLLPFLIVFAINWLHRFTNVIHANEYGNYFSIRIAWICVVVLGVMALLGWLQGQFIRWLEPDWDVHYRSGTVLYSYLFSAIAVSFWEEFVFRGYIITTLMKHGKSPLISILISTFVFSLLHVNGIFAGEILLFCSILVGGFLLGLIYVVTNNIYIPIMVHLMHNFLFIRFDPRAASVIQVWDIVSLGLVAIILFGVYLRKLTGISSVKKAV